MDDTLVSPAMIFAGLVGAMASGRMSKSRVGLPVNAPPLS